MTDLMSYDEHAKPKQRDIDTGVKLPDGKSRIIEMVREQQNRDKLKERLIRKMRRFQEIESGLSSGFGSDYFGGEDD